MLSLEKSRDSQFASLSKIKSCVRRPEESPIRAPEPFRAQDGIQLVQHPGDRAPVQRHLARPPGRLSAAIIAARYVPRSPGPGYSTAGTVGRPRAAQSPPWRALPNRDAVQAARPGQVIERSPRNQTRPPATPRPGACPRTALGLSRPAGRSSEAHAQRSTLLSRQLPQNAGQRPSGSDGHPLAELLAQRHRASRAGRPCGPAP